MLEKKKTNFEFDEKCKCAFEEIKDRLIRAPIMATPDWNKEFEIMCDSNDYAMGPMLGQRNEKIFRAIYYANKTFIEAQETYLTTENEMLQWYFLIKNLGHTFWGPMLLYTLIMQQSNIYGKERCKAKVNQMGLIAIIV